MVDGDTPEEELPALSLDDFEFYKSRYVDVLNGMRGRINTRATPQQLTDLRTDLETRITEVRNELVNSLNGHNTRINDLVEALNRLQTEVVNNYNRLWERCNEVQRYSNQLQTQINDLSRRIASLE